MSAADRHRSCGRKRRMPRSCQKFPTKAIGMVCLAVGYREHAAEGKDRAERQRWIRPEDPLTVLSEEVRGLFGIQHSKHGNEPGALVPLGHRVLARSEEHTS